MIVILILFLLFSAGVVIIGFERVTQDNGNPLAIREGETLELCVVLMSGTLPFEIQVQTFADLREYRKKRQAISKFQEMTR